MPPILGGLWKHVKRGLTNFVARVLGKKLEFCGVLSYNIDARGSFTKKYYKK